MYICGSDQLRGPKSSYYLKGDYLDMCSNGVEICKIVCEHYEHFYFFTPLIKGRNFRGILINVLSPFYINKLQFAQNVCCPINFIISKDNKGIIERVMK